MEELKAFASYVKNYKFGEFVNSEIELLYELNAPILKFFAHLSKEEIFARAGESLMKFLTGIETGTAIELAKQNQERWEKDESPEIPRDAVSMLDVEMINSAQKISLLRILPHYTNDVTVATAIMTDLEKYYNEVQILSIRVLERIQSEARQKLQETEEKYRDLFDNASDLVHLAQPGGEVIYANNAWLKTLGYSLEELRGSSVYAYVSEQDKDRFRQYRERVLSDPFFTGSIDVCLISKAGREIYVDGTVSCKFKDGKPLYTRGMLHNITNRRANEAKLKYYNEELQAREEALRQLIHNAPDAVIVINEESNIVIWNPKAEEIFGWKAYETIGHPLVNIIIPPAFRKAHISRFQRYLVTGEAGVVNKTIEVTALNKSGAEFYISLNMSKSSQAGRTLFISFIRDIDQQKKNELELERKRKELIQKNKELEQYAWLTSHDLKEPVRKILTFSGILLDKNKDRLDPLTLTKLNKIHDSAMRMAQLIDAILLYSNVTGSGDQFIDTDLGVVISEVLSDLELRIREEKAVISIEDTLPVIKADPVQMRQLFQNLISNAIKYKKPDTAPVIQISSVVSVDKVKISIKDNGQGFENEYAERIFKIFQRLVTRDQYEGTRIGLALCRKIVAHHGGTITATSEEGKGSIFEIILPKDLMSKLDLFGGLS